MPLHVNDLPPALAKSLGLEPSRRRQKYNAVAILVDGERFDSLKEARYWQELKIRERLGEIENVQRQPQFLITRDGVVVATYRADFRFTDRRTHAWVVVDCKGGKVTRTEAYQLRRNLVEAQHGVQILEV